MRSRSYGLQNRRCGRCSRVGRGGVRGADRVGREAEKDAGDRGHGVTGFPRLRGEFCRTSG